MERFEYIWSSDSETVINERAKAGWEVVLADRSGEDDMSPILMKRPIAQEPEPSLGKALNDERIAALINAAMDVDGLGLSFTEPRYNAAVERLHTALQKVQVMP